MGDPNAEIEKLFLEKGIAFSAKTTGHILRLFEVVGYDRIFNKTVVKELIGLKDSGASKFLSNWYMQMLLEQSLAMERENTGSKSNG